MNKSGGFMVLSWFMAVVMSVLAVAGSSRDPILGFDGATPDTTRPRVKVTLPDTGIQTIKAFGGYQFNRYLAIEGGYFDLGLFEFTVHIQPPGSMVGKLELDGFNVGGVGILPLRDGFGICSGRLESRQKPGSFMW